MTSLSLNRNLFKVAFINMQDSIPMLVHFKCYTTLFYYFILWTVWNSHYICTYIKVSLLEVLFQYISTPANIRMNQNLISLKYKEYYFLWSRIMNILVIRNTSLCHSIVWTQMKFEISKTYDELRSNINYFSIIC